MSDARAERIGKILVVDDNEPNRLLASMTLEEEGYEVVLATGGEEGVAAFCREDPDCVILDVRMPGVDGFAASERIRATGRGASIPILFLTALRDVETFDKALAAGADDFLTKPIRPSELVARVSTALRLRQLDSERRELVEVVRRQRDELVRVQLQRERLMAFVVHDLKNPVNTIDLHAQIILRDKTSTNAARSSAAQIRDDARRLTRLIMNLLDIAKAEEGKLAASLVRTDVSALAREVTHDMETPASAKGVSVALQGEALEGSIDPDLVRRILSNLLDNAIRHAPQGSVVKVTVASKGSFIVMRVADQGGGVPEGMRDKVFEPFLQVTEGKDASRGGRGLGLTFSKLAVEAHRGRIWVEDGAPGAVFCVEVPRDG